MAHLFTQPLDIDPMPVMGTILVSTTSSAPIHAITLDRPLSHFDFEDSNEGKCNHAALQRLQSLLRLGLCSPPNPNSPLPRASWLVIATELVVTLHQSIRTSHGNDPSPRIFTNLDSEETNLLRLLGRTCEALFDFFGAWKTNHEDWSTCLRCLEQCHRPINEAKYESVAMTCGQSIAAIHSTIVNDTVRTLHNDAAKWSERQLQAIKDALINGIVSEATTDGNILLTDSDTEDNRLANWLKATSHDLREHARSMILGGTVDKYLVPWASERMDAAAGQLLATSTNRIRDLRADAERRANDDAHKFYTENLAALKVESHARAVADAYTSYQEEMARLKAEAKDAFDNELAAFKHGLKIETAERKANALALADKSVAARERSSAKAQKGKARHDPMGTRSRAPSVSGSPTPSLIPLPSTPEIQTASLLESAQIEITPRAIAFKTPEVASEAMAPIMSHLDALKEHKMTFDWQTVIDTISANTQRQLTQFSESVSKQIQETVAPIASRVLAIEKENEFITDSAWGHENDDDFMEFSEADATPVLPTPKFIDAIYRRIHQVSDGVPISHHYHLGNIKEMTQWFDNTFSPKYKEIDRQAERLPPHIETELARAYKAWYERDSDGWGPTAAGPPSRADTLHPQTKPAATQVAALSSEEQRPTKPGQHARPSTTGGVPRIPRPSESRGKDQAHFCTQPLPTVTPMDTIEFPPLNVYGTELYDTNTIPSEEEGGNWLRPTGHQNRRRNQREPASFAVAVSTPIANPTPATAMNPAIATRDLSKADLDKLPKADVIRAFNSRFNGGMSSNTKMSKDSIVATYIAKSNAPPPPPTRPKPLSPPKVLSTTQYTVVRNPTTAGLAKVTSRTHPDAAVVRALQRALRQHFPTGQKVPVDLIGGRWGAMTSANFVLVFNGTPSNLAVMQCRSIFFDFFGRDCVIVPQKGYSRVLLRSVPLVRDASGSLASSESLAQELSRNLLYRDLTLFCPPRWLKADAPLEAAHGSVVVTFLDDDGARTRNILQTPVYMFGGRARACKFNPLPLLQQCDRCWRLGHASKRCPKPKALTVCSICGAAHQAADHQFKCSGMNRHSSLKCGCPRKCINCARENTAEAAGHLATDHSCPLRKKFRTPFARTGDTTDEESRIPTPMIQDETSLAPPVDDDTTIA